MTPNDSTLTIYHLDNSRSGRVIWLAEELSIGYTVVRYERDARRQAPPEYKSLHPLGRSPMVRVDSHVIAESVAIFEYLLLRHDRGRLAPLPGSGRYVDYLQWLHFAEGTLSPHHLALSVLRHANVTHGPSWDGMMSSLQKDIDYVEATLSAHPFIVGDAFTAADLMMFTALTSAMQFAEFLPAHPHIEAYVANLARRSAYRTALTFG